MRRLKRCASPQCRNFTESMSEAFCSEHKGETNRFYNQWRNKYDKETVAFYKSAAWRKTRKVALRQQQYLCQDCLELEEVYTTADVVDHVIELRDNWSKRLELSNLRCLCHDHHNRKTAREAKRRNT